MDYLKYMNNKQYYLNSCNCWTFIQDVFQKEEGYKLPDVPIFDDFAGVASNLKSNVKYIVLNKAHKGCLIHLSYSSEHIGYAISDKQYIHRKKVGVLISDIPKNAIIYEVIK